MNRIEVKNKQLLLNGVPAEIHSGSLHYFRIHPALWNDRIQRLKATGLNTAELYINWSLHEEAEGTFTITEHTDFLRMIDLVRQNGLKVILRPGPYICSELDFGGMPPWLLAKPGLRIRSSENQFVFYAVRYMKWVAEKVKPLLYTNGGPIIFYQIENEYGYYGNDHKYMDILSDAVREAGIDIPLVTSDGSHEFYLLGGSQKDALISANVRSNPESELTVYRKFRPDQPDFCMELHNGTFSACGEPQHRHEAESVRKDIRELLAAKAIFNIYMVHGGSSFGYLAGATSRNNRFSPFPASYDTDAPVTEAGHYTEKFTMLREELGATGEIPAELPVKAYGKVEFKESVSLFEALPVLSSPIQVDYPETMEYYGQSYGFILYRMRLPLSYPYELQVNELRDHALVYLNSRLAGEIPHDAPDKMIFLPEAEPGAVLDILVENQGRRCGTVLMQYERKGLRGITLFGQQQCGMEVWPLPLKKLPDLPFNKDKKQGGPAFYRGMLEVDTQADTFIHLPGSTHGIVWINGFMLGRYWPNGPQLDLYVPAPLLHSGKNEIIVFETREWESPCLLSKDTTSFLRTREEVDKHNKTQKGK